MVNPSPPVKISGCTPDSVGTSSAFCMGNAPECEDDHSPPCSAEAKNEMHMYPSSPICLHEVDREDFTFSCIKNGGYFPL
jgi:hypothetical protein